MSRPCPVCREDTLTTARSHGPAVRECRLVALLREAFPFIPDNGPGTVGEWATGKLADRVLAELGEGGK